MSTVIDTLKAVRVLFNDPEEFIKELQLNRTHMRLPIVRLTQQFEQSGALPITHVRVLASYLFDQADYVHLVRLKRPCGEVMAGEPFDQTGAGKRAAKVIAQVEAAAAELDLQVRAGEFQLLDPDCFVTHRTL